MSAQEALSAGALLASGTVNTLLNARVLGLGCYAAESLLQTAAKLATQSAVVGARALRSRGAARASGGGGGGGSGGVSWRTRTQLVGSAVCDLVGFLLYQQGLVRCGPALYQVACSAQVVFGVAFSAAFVGARYSLGQLVAVAWVVGSIAARGALAASKAGAGDEGDAGAVTFGILMVLLGCAVYSAGAVLVTRMNRDCVRAGETPPSGSDVSAANGVVGLCFILVYLAAYTVPRWTELVTDVQAASGVTPWEVLSTHAIYLACYVVHNAVSARAPARKHAIVRARTCAPACVRPPDSHTRPVPAIARACRTIGTASRAPASRPHSARTPSALFPSPSSPPRSCAAATRLRSAWTPDRWRALWRQQVAARCTRSRPPAQARPGPRSSRRRKSSRARPRHQQNA